MTTPTEERGGVWDLLESRSIPEPNTGCLIWLGATRGRGYGTIYINGRTRPAHVVAYELAFGPVPPGHDACRHCDNPPCILPAHLFSGTPSENMLDASRKGRSLKRFCRRGHALTPDNIRLYRHDRGYTIQWSRNCLTCDSTRDRNNQARRLRLAALAEPAS